MSSAPLTREVGRPGVPRSVAEAELALREQLSNVRGLLALSLLMTERRDEDEILHLAITATPALVVCRVVGVHLDGRGWYDDSSFADHRSAERAARQLVDVSAGGGPVAVPDATWAWAFQLPRRGGARRSPRRRKRCRAAGHGPETAALTGPADRHRRGQRPGARRLPHRERRPGRDRRPPAPQERDPRPLHPGGRQPGRVRRHRSGTPRLDGADCRRRGRPRERPRPRRTAGRSCPRCR